MRVIILCGHYRLFENLYCLYFAQALPLLAMIHPVDPGKLLQFITSYTPIVDQQEQTLSEGLETECTFVTYDKMTAEQQELVDDVLEEHEDFTEPLAVKAINELGNEADIGNIKISLGVLS